jgi:hypothetical protein
MAGGIDNVADNRFADASEHVRHGVDYTCCCPGLRATLSLTGLPRSPSEFVIAIGDGAFPKDHEQARSPRARWLLTDRPRTAWLRLPGPTH